jgi:hypothetical protein
VSAVEGTVRRDSHTDITGVWTKILARCLHGMLPLEWAALSHHPSSPCFPQSDELCNSSKPRLSQVPWDLLSTVGFQPSPLISLQNLLLEKHWTRPLVMLSSPFSFASVAMSSIDDC